ncbi:hypothetical protein DFR71_2909 [Nocardia alba]|uniref:Uncharacterized protein n=1 Tax=Nocardia alba TaxID=225051 RepID=A0A4V2PBE7_9NOCA|nr:hypothetical protein DFR71_2909 [Nocardia alba]
MDIADTEIRFVDYPFAGALVYPDGVIEVSAITEADPGAIPPHLRTVTGEMLFVHAEHRPALDDFCRRNTIAVRRRLDVWADLLEPFLDTWFDDEDQRATEARLLGVGLAAQEIVEIRGRVERAMMSYNFDSMLWEWVHLNLYDLLSAANGVLTRPEARATLGDPVALYRWAMEIAGRAVSS